MHAKRFRCTGEDARASKTASVETRASSPVLVPGVEDHPLK